MAVLSWVMARFVGFPLHPVGMALGLTFAHLPGVVLRLHRLAAEGDDPALRWPQALPAAAPIFPGFILGALGSGSIWLVIDALTGMTGNRFTVG